MQSEIHSITMEHQVPAGALGPESMTLDVRAHLVPPATGIVLVDTGIEPTGHALDAAVNQVGATWSDVSQGVPGRPAVVQSWA
jgi:hypothetical protein